MRRIDDPMRGSLATTNLTTNFTKLKTLGHFFEWKLFESWAKEVSTVTSSNNTVNETIMKRKSKNVTEKVPYFLHLHMLLAQQQTPQTNLLHNKETQTCTTNI